MTPAMQQRWFWTIGAVFEFAYLVFYPDAVLRLISTTTVVLFVVQGTLAWRDYLEWRVFWDAEQRKGMPE